MNKSAFSFIFIVASAVAVYFSSSFHFIEDFLKVTPQIIIAIFGLSFFICLRFNKSRVFFILVLLLLWFYKSKLSFIAAIPNNEFMFLISLNVLYIVLSKERGMISVHGAKKAVIILFQIALIFFFTVYQPHYYVGSYNSFVRTVHSVINMQFYLLPFILIGASAIKNIIFDKSYEVSAVIGVFAALLLMTSFGIVLSELNVIVAFAFAFAGILSSIYSVSYIDELTGLPARRAYNEYTASLGSKYAIAMTDIDHFKKFNDTYGHDTGDEVLKLVAKVIASVGGGGKTFRFGGEEFVIVFNGKTKEETVEYLENIREKLQNTPFTVRNRKNRKKYKKTGKKSGNDSSKAVKITMSIGASDSRAEKNVAKVMKKADQALYKAKKTGRNKVVA